FPLRDNGLGRGPLARGLRALAVSGGHRTARLPEPRLRFAQLGFQASRGHARQDLAVGDELAFADVDVGKTTRRLARDVDLGRFDAAIAAGDGAVGRGPSAVPQVESSEHDRETNDRRECQAAPADTSQSTARHDALPPALQSRDRGNDSLYTFSVASAYRLAVRIAALDQQHATPGEERRVPSSNDSIGRIDKTASTRLSCTYSG